MLLAESGQFPCLFQRVVFPRLAGRVDAVVQHWEHLALQAPCLIFRQVPVKDVYLVTCQDRYFPFQFVRRDIGASYILHEAAMRKAGQSVISHPVIAMPLPFFSVNWRNVWIAL